MTRLDLHCLGAYADVPSEAHQDCDGTEEGAHQGVQRKHICKKIKSCGANVLLVQKSILQDAYNELSLHFLEKIGILVVTMCREDRRQVPRPWVLTCTARRFPDPLEAWFG